MIRGDSGRIPVFEGRLLAKFNPPGRAAPDGTAQTNANSFAQAYDVGHTFDFTDFQSPPQTDWAARQGRSVYITDAKKTDKAPMGMCVKLS
jgi:hypothetical protein